LRGSGGTAYTPQRSSRSTEVGVSLVKSEPFYAFEPLGSSDSTETRD
jgi:hypothetical protein